MFRFKSKNNANIKIKDLNIVIKHNNWTYVDDKKVISSKDIKKNASKLIIETNNNKYKKSKVKDVKINNQNDMYTIEPKDNEVLTTTKSIENDTFAINPPKEIGIQEETNSKIDKNSIQDDKTSVNDIALEKNNEETKEVIEEKVEMPNETNIKIENDFIKNNENTNKEEINKENKDINKIEKTSKRGRKPKNEVTE